jgi:hypothetical protein
MPKPAKNRLSPVISGEEEEREKRSDHELEGLSDEDDDTEAFDRDFPATSGRNIGGPYFQQMPERGGV